MANPPVNMSGLPFQPGFVPRTFRFALYLLLTYLACILIIGKGPTYLGVPPVFWGEIVMGLGILYLIHGKPDHRWFGHKYDLLAMTVLSWVFLGLVRTAFTFPRWGLDALRDAAIWYYASFFFIGLGVACREYWAAKVWSALKVIWLLALCWGTTNWLSHDALTQAGPMLPWRGVPLFTNARDDVAQNSALGALIVFCLRSWSRAIDGLRPLLLPIAVLGLSLFAGSEGRAVKVAFGVATLSVLTLLTSARSAVPFSRRYSRLLLAAVPVLLILFLTVPDMAGKMQLDRFAENNKEGQDTKAWRAIWWDRLYQAVLKQNPVFGLGFGESLHVYHPMITDQGKEWEVRSPHNFNMTVFTRMGFLGMSLWILILLIGIGRLYMRIWRGTINGEPYTDERRDELTFWLFMLICTYVNSSMGVLMEGPVFGISFWFALGFAQGRSASTGVPSAANTLAEMEKKILLEDLTKELKAYRTPALETASRRQGIPSVPCRS